MPLFACTTVSLLMSHPRDEAYFCCHGALFSAHSSRHWSTVFPLGRLRHTITASLIECTGTWFRHSCTEHLAFSTWGLLVPYRNMSEVGVLQRCAGCGLKHTAHTACKSSLICSVGQLFLVMIKGVYLFCTFTNSILAWLFFWVTFYWQPIPKASVAHTVQNSQANILSFLHCYFFSVGLLISKHPQTMNNGAGSIGRVHSSQQFCIGPIGLCNLCTRRHFADALLLI